MGNNLNICLDVFVCLFIYLEHKFYYIVNTLLSPMHRQVSRIKYQHRLFIGVLFQIGPRHFSGKPHITQSKKNFFTKKIKKIILPKKCFRQKNFFQKKKKKKKKKS